MLLLGNVKHLALKLEPSVSALTPARIDPDPTAAASIPLTLVTLTKVGSKCITYFRIGFIQVHIEKTINILGKALTCSSENLGHL